MKYLYQNYFCYFFVFCKNISRISYWTKFERFYWQMLFRNDELPNLWYVNILGNRRFLTERDIGLLSLFNNDGYGSVSSLLCL